MRPFFRRNSDTAARRINAANRRLGYDTPEPWTPARQADWDADVRLSFYQHYVREGFDKQTAAVLARAEIPPLMWLLAREEVLGTPYPSEPQT